MLPLHCWPWLRASTRHIHFTAIIYLSHKVEAAAYSSLLPPPGASGTAHAELIYYGYAS